MKRSFLSMAVTIVLLGFCILGVTAVDSINSVSAATTLVPPPTNPQTSNATLGYDLANRLRENDNTCTYEWGPMLVIYQKGDTSIFNYSSTSPIDTYVFSSDYYHGPIGCALGPIVHADENVAVYTGEHWQFIVAAPGSFYVLFINHDPTVTPHVTLEIAVSLHPTTTTTTVSLPLFVIAVSVILLAVLVGLFVVARKKKRMGADRGSQREQKTSSALMVAPTFETEETEERPIGHVETRILAPMHGKRETCHTTEKTDLHTSPMYVHIRIRHTSNHPISLFSHTI